MNIFENPDMPEIVRLDGRYSAFGKINDRPFIVDGESIDEVQTLRQELKAEVLQKEASRPDCLRNVTWLESRRFRARPDQPFNPGPEAA